MTINPIGNGSDLLYDLERIINISPGDTFHYNRSINKSLSKGFNHIGLGIKSSYYNSFSNFWKNLTIERNQNNSINHDTINGNNLVFILAIFI